ncbi:MAG TPA: ABC transporter substrate-binding protein [Actinomycetales bacterium]|nr:ABC transporter substrate-binding protein [Actinomycetales bacterium]
MSLPSLSKLLSARTTSSSPVRMGIAAVAAALLLGACGSSDASGGTDSDAASDEEVTVETNDGEKTVPVLPQRVAILDNTAMETLQDWGIEPVALPKPLLPKSKFSEWIDDESIADAGSHREPILEAVSEAEPDLIIGGYRFEEYTDDLEKIAPVIDLAPSDERFDTFVDGLKHQTLTLGEIFDKQQEADDLIEKFEESVEKAADATNGESVFLAVTSGNAIDNGAGRIGRIIEPLNLTDVFANEDLDAESVHQDSGMAPETVAQANPDWTIVLDRDAAIETAEDAAPAATLLAAQEAWKNVTFMEQDQVIYLDPYFYTREGIQAYIEAYDQIAEAFGG